MSEITQFCVISRYNQLDFKGILGEEVVKSGYIAGIIIAIKLIAVLLYPFA